MDADFAPILLWIGDNPAPCIRQSPRRKWCVSGFVPHPE